MKKKIVIAGASAIGVKNAGDDAMFKALCDNLKKEIPRVKLVFLARHLDKKFDKIFGVKSIKNFEHNNRKESLGRFFYGFNAGDDPQRLANIKKEISQAALVIIVGNSFMEVSANEFLRGVASYSATLAILTKFLGRPYVLFGVHGHPLKNEFTKKIAKFLCNNAEFVTLREKFFRKELIKAGADPTKLKTYADPALGLEPVEGKKRGRTILKKENIRFKSDKIVGVCFRHMYWIWKSKEFDKYAGVMAKLCDFVVEKIGADILFIPNCTYNIDDLHEDDRLISHYVKKRMKYKAKAYLIRTDLYLPDRLALYNLLSMVVSNRRHISMAAATHGIPFVAISTGHMWQFKPFAKRLNMKPQQLVDLVNERLVEIKQKIEYVWQHQKEIREKNLKATKTLQKIAKNQVKAIAKFAK